jgi:hypothetical protein
MATASLREHLEGPIPLGDVLDIDHSELVVNIGW